MTRPNHEEPEMADENDKQAEALIAALAPKIAEALLPQITESVETQMKGFKVRRGTRKGPPQFTPMDNVAVVFGHGTRCHPVVPVHTKETHLQQQEYGSGGFVPNKG